MNLKEIETKKIEYKKCLIENKNLKDKIYQNQNYLKNPIFNKKLLLLIMKILNLKVICIKRKFLKLRVIFIEWN